MNNQGRGGGRLGAGGIDSCIILVQGFCLLKIKITQFPDGFRLNLLHRIAARENLTRLVALSNLSEFMVML